MVDQENSPAPYSAASVAVAKLTSRSICVGCSLETKKAINIAEGESPSPSPSLFLLSVILLVELVEILAYMSVTDPFSSFSARFEWGCEC